MLTSPVFGATDITETTQSKSVCVCVCVRARALALKMILSHQGQTTPQVTPSLGLLLALTSTRACLLAHRLNQS